VICSKRDRFSGVLGPGVRAAAMKPPAARKTTSRACISGTPLSSSVKGWPATRSPLTTRVPPTLAHSARICPTVARSAASHTRPSLNDRRTAGAAATVDAATPNTTQATRRSFIIF